jgi:hypothetical protein
MSRTISSLALLLTLLGASVSFAEDKSQEDEGRESEATILTAKGRLAEELVIRDSQGGFAGFSGWIWTIEPDGGWRREPFLNEDVRKADQTGKLTAEDLAALAKDLEEHGLLKLPENIGGEPMVNPHVFTITFGKLQSQLVLGAGAELPEPEGKGKPKGADRFAAIVRAVKARVEVKEKEE